MKALTKTLAIASIACATAVAALPAAAVEISFYYPIAVSGPLTKIIDSMAADFEKANPDIKVKPIYSGNYGETLAKALTANKSGSPPQVAVLVASDTLTLIDEDLLKFETIWAAAGTPNAVFRLTPRELAALTGGRVADVAAR